MCAARGVTCPRFMPSRKTSNSQPLLGVIGGSGLARLANLKGARKVAVQTPYGEPSAPLLCGTIEGRKVVFLTRHGDGHVFAPHEINYRANLWALRAVKVKDVVSIATVGGIRTDLVPGTLAVPDQIIDYTWGRTATFSPLKGRGVMHIDFTHPYCEILRRRLLAAASMAGETVAAGGTYAATQGPRLETAAEIARLERDGADMVGMTGMPEAALARELGLCYAAVAVVVNHAAGRGASAQAISHANMEAVSRRAMKRVQHLLDRLVEINGR
jgi:5'-deoxy-5'-methylthioadenosine phosphorylase